MVNKKTRTPTIPEFYDGRSVFISGAAGFLGVVLVETLLRCCPGIKSIFILLREKKGVSPEERRKEIFTRKIFSKLREDSPEVFDKVRMLAGDVSLPNMGLGEEDTWADGSVMRDVIDQVSVVFHCAATINFLKPASFVVQQNVIGTENVIQLCKKMKKMEVLIYSSTACSNCNRHCVIEERVYGMPYPPQRFIEVVKSGDESTLTEMVSQCQPPWPNHYTLSKCISENLLEQVKEFQVVIVRPSLIAQTWKGPMPGYSEENSNLGQIYLGVAKGFMKVIIVDDNVAYDMVPMDLVVNVHIVSSWYSVVFRPPSPFVINNTSYGSFPMTFGELISTTVVFAAKYPNPNTMRAAPYLVTVKSKILYDVLAFVEHYLTAYVIDLILRLRGKKPKLVRLYNFLDKVVETSRYFALNSWKYDIGHYKELQEVLKPEDEANFYLNGEDMDLASLMDSLSTGSLFCDWSIDNKSREVRLTQAYRILVLTRVVQIIFFLLLSWIIYVLYTSITAYL